MFAILHIIPFTNAKVERPFSKLNCIKTIERNRLGCDSLDLPLHVEEEVVTDMWFSDKVHRLTAGSHQPKCKREVEVASSSNVELTPL